MKKNKTKQNKKQINQATQAVLFIWKETMINI